LAMDLREKECHEIAEVMLNNVLPGGVFVGAIAVRFHAWV
jgi:hypothetical protein